MQQDTASQSAAFKRAGIKRIVEEKRSGGGAARPLLEALLQKLGVGDWLIVYRIDRLARSLGDLLRILARVKAAGAFFRSLTEPIETSTPVGELLLQMLGAIAQFERAIIAERCAAGRAEAVLRGVRFGSPPRIDRARALALVASGLNYTQTARRLGCSPSALRKAVNGSRRCDGGPGEHRERKSESARNP